MEKNDKRNKIITYFIRNPLSINDRFKTEEELKERNNPYKRPRKKFIVFMYTYLSVVFAGISVFFSKADIMIVVIAYSFLTLFVILSDLLMKNYIKLYNYGYDDLGIEKFFLMLNIKVINGISTMYEKYFDEFAKLENDKIYFEREVIDFENIKRISKCSNILIFVYEVKKNLCVKFIDCEISDCDLTKLEGLFIEDIVDIEKVEKKELNNYLNQNTNRKFIYLLVTVFSPISLIIVLFCVIITCNKILG